MEHAAPFAMLMEFIEASLHCFLYSRSIYPSSFFAQSTSFDTPVWRCRHSVLCGYLQTLLASIGGLMKSNSMSAFTIVQCTKEAKEPLERLSLLIKSFGSPTAPLVEKEFLSVKTKLQTLILKVLDTGYKDKESPLATTFYVVVKLKSEDANREINMESLLSPVAPWHTVYDERGENSSKSAWSAFLGPSENAENFCIDLVLESSQ